MSLITFKKLPHRLPKNCGTPCILCTLRWLMCARSLLLHRLARFNGQHARVRTQLHRVTRGKKKPWIRVSWTVDEYNKEVHGSAMSHTAWQNGYAEHVHHFNSIAMRATRNTPKCPNMLFSRFTVGPFAQIMCIAEANLWRWRFSGVRKEFLCGRIV